MRELLTLTTSLQHEKDEEEDILFQIVVDPEHLTSDADDDLIALPLVVTLDSSSGGRMLERFRLRMDEGFDPDVIDLVTAAVADGLVAMFAPTPEEAGRMQVISGTMPLEAEE